MASQTGRSGIRDVAQLAGVSKSSVSNFFNQPDRLSDKTRARIKAAVDALDFVPSNAARELRTGASDVIGVIAFETDNPYFQVFAHAVEQEAERAGLFMMLATSNSDRREREYLDLFERQRVRGILISPVGPVEERLLQISRRGIPAVIFGHGSSNRLVPSVAANNFHGGEIVAKHLCDIGYRRLAFVGAGFDVPQIADRLQGALQEASQHAGVTLEVIDAGERSILAGVAVAEQIARRDQFPDAIIAANDL
ncbi:MAG: LacI family transcriptional regulator, partial [Microbacteriaceae bacterium]|nr:LacI family transcriptional regulator [Microbacteriaceae bacterium]